MVSVLPHFNSRRVLHDYLVGYYGPAARHGQRLAADEFAAARELAEWKRRVHKAWPSVTLRLLSLPKQIQEECQTSGIATKHLLYGILMLKPKNGS